MKKKRVVTGAVGWAIVMAFSSAMFTGFVLASGPLGELNGYTTAQFSLFFSLFTAGAMIGNAVIGKLLSKLGIRRLGLIGALSPLIVFLTLAFSGNLIIIYVVGFLCGFLNTFANFVPYSVYISSWFTSGTGKMMSIGNILMNALGIVATPVIASLISSLGVRSAVIGIGVVYTAVEVVCLLFLTTKLPGECGAEPIALGEKQKSGGQASAVAEQYEPAMPPRKLLGIPVTILALAVPGLITIGATMFATYNIYIFQSFGLEYVNASLLVSLTQIFAVVYLFLFGICNDRIGTKKSVVIFTIPAIVSSFLCPMLSGWAAAIVLACLCRSIMYNGMYPGLVYPPLFGQKNSGTLIGWSGAVSGLGGVVAAPLAAAMFNASGNYNSMLIVSGVIYIVSLLLSLVVMSGKSARTIREKDEAYCAAHAAHES